MKQIFHRLVNLLCTILIFCFVLSGCSNVTTPEATKPPLSGHSNTSKPTSPTPTATAKGTRDNSPLVLVPTASGTETHSVESAVIDVSETSDGYIMVNYTGTNKKVKLQLKNPDGITYTYNLHPGGYEVFPLTAGDGTYTVGIYENISGTKYSTLLSTSIDVVITNTFGPYLYPNQYVDFDADSLPVAKASELALSANTDLEVVEQVYNYIIENFSYDYDKAATVVSGYLPVVDDVYLSNTGICFDYAAVMATMLRSQNIPTRLEVGYVDTEYHAWISTYIDDIGWINGIIEFDGINWHLLDPTFASTSKTPKKFLTKDSKYLTKFLY